MKMEQRQSSFMSKLPVILVTIEEKKAELSSKKLELLEAKRLGKDAEELEIEWGSLESEIDLLEHTANVMRTDLMQKGLDDIKYDMLLVNAKV
ncbi:hypothetical protein L6452_23017 [Arctium lappa]|uniref:Uncharacterized protein n=1 Tax=Arctium lappa TaxID=4217 RepID=A0ACB9B0F8_ARCLA|nr:hypothetical protein L6452_23017 [Arctium lappa]